MEEPNYEKILKSKIEYYGRTEFAYQVTAEEYTRQYIELNNLSQHLVSKSLITPFMYSDTEYWSKWFDCPKCEVDYIKEDSKFCPNCGTEIEW